MNIEYEQFKKKKMGQNSGQSRQPKTTQNVKKEPNFFFDGNGNIDDLDFGTLNKRTERVPQPRQPTSYAPTVKKEEDREDIPDIMRLDNIKLGSSQKILIRNVEVLFPFVPYEAQVDYMTSVIDALNGKKNALLQSPTGTGKTLSLLCATLAWVHKNRSLYDRNIGHQDYKPVRIYYSTRTHSQIKQVVKELKQTCYRPVISILGSRNQLCVKSDFSELTGFQLNSACKAARTSNIPEHRCQFYDTLNKNKTLIINQNKTSLYDIEELANIGKKSRFCPYFLQRDLQTKAELIFLPYNYLLDANIRTTSEIDLTDSIVIFDEAHNLENNAEEACSFDFSLRTLEQSELDFKLLRQKFRQTPEECKISERDIGLLEYPIQSLFTNMSRMKANFEKDFRQDSRNPNRSEDQPKGRVCSGRDIFDIFEGMTYEKTTQNMVPERDNSFRNGITAGNFDAFVKLLKQAVDELTNVPTSKGGLEHILQFSSFVFDLLKLDVQSKARGATKEFSQNFIDSYLLYVHFNDDDFSDFCFSLWCLNPAVGFSFMKEQKPLSVVLTSGTLTPFKSFGSELQLEFPIELINKHVIDTKSRCYTVVLKKGPANCPLNFSYERREDTAIYNEMGTTLINIARLVPNGILVCFASYGLMQKCFELWQSPDQRILKRLEELKPVYREPKKSAQLKTVMNQYLKDAKTKGAILCCVCRGKVSEGIDFADEMARAVVLVGIPFPPTTDIKIKHKKKFLDENKTKTNRLSGGDWYLQQTTRVFNQAIGRVIRHINDYGVVFLCDERYGSDQFRNEYPNWIKDNLEVVDKFGFMVGKVASFFKDKNRELTSIAKLISKPNVNPTPTQIPSTLNNEASISFDQESSRGNILLERPPAQNTTTNKESSTSFSSILVKDFKRKFDQTTPSSFDSPSSLGGFSIGNQTPREPPVVHSHYLEIPRTENINQSDTGAARSFKDIIDKKNAMLMLKKESPYQNSGIKRIKKEEEVQEGKISALEEDIFLEETIPINRTQVQNEVPPPFRLSSDVLPPSLDNNFDNLFPEDNQSKKLVSKPRVSGNLNRLLSFNSNESSELPPLDPINRGIKNQSSFGSLSLENSNKVSPDTNQTPGVECIICYEKGSGRNMMASKCGHIACAACWEKWLNIKFECPACKAKVRTKQLIKLHI